MADSSDFKHDGEQQRIRKKKKLFIFGGEECKIYIIKMFGNEKQREELIGYKWFSMSENVAHEEVLFVQM